MLNPDERAHLLELLRPPTGCQLDLAVGTTFSLDLLSALVLPLSFALFDWEQEDGEPVADPLAMLEALRRYGDRLTVFCQAGQIRLPRQYARLITFLERSIYEIQPPDPEGVFHPKVWVLRFTAEDGAIRYRVLCLSRNLTFDRCWDTVVALDGELGDRLNAIAANHPLGDLLEALPRLAVRRLPAGRRQGILRVADEVRRVRFTWPEGFDGRQCRFWVSGLNGRAAEPFGSRRDQSLVVAPFVSNSVIRDFLEHGGKTHLVSRPESLQELPKETLEGCASVHYLQPQLSEEASDEHAAVASGEVLSGLHAKLFVIDRGREASVFTGSFNATVHALEHNVEFMVELSGKKSRFGVDVFLRQVNGETRFADLLQKYDPSLASTPTDPTQQALDERLQAARRAVTEGGARLVLTPAGEKDLFEMHLQWQDMPSLPPEDFAVWAWPITLSDQSAQPLAEAIVFRRLSFEALTPLIAFEVRAEVRGTKGRSIFVMNLPLEGAPEDREDRVLASMLAGRDQLLRYLLFLLAAGDESGASSRDVVGLLAGGNPQAEMRLRLPCLLETMLRALHRQPEQLQRVASLLDALRRAPNTADLLSADFQTVWEPIWQAAQHSKRG